MAEHTGENDHTQRTLLARAAARAGRRATLDPGAFVKRKRDADGGYERLDQWQERALLAAVDALVLPPGSAGEDRG